MTDEQQHYIKAFSKIIGIEEHQIEEYVNQKGMTALVENAAQLLTTKEQKEKHQAFIDLYRMTNALTNSQPILKNPSTAASFFRSVMPEIYDKESMVVAFLDAKYRVIGHKQISVGTLTESLVHPREVFRDAIINKAHTIVVGHNHPSGDVTPSREDYGITERLVEAGQLVGIQLADHIIITGLSENRVYSFGENGELWQSPQHDSIGESVSPDTPKRKPMKELLEAARSNSTLKRVEARDRAAVKNFSSDRKLDHSQKER